ncbi:telomerase Cajal body protein 1 [Babesia caballi]|uniref:Telomerase Cajal body protein 1 n=1 Tax=Babesia caballi TaxID=5871 RepID=A0AAV4M0Y0_BABCB|nr:telomerase Cajal body protein 1 [Babesia caballi]
MNCSAADFATAVKPKLSAKPQVTESPIAHIECHEDIRDVCFFPNFKHSDPDSCCLLTASRGNPVRLHDTHTGKQHFTYKAIDLREELAETYSLDFHPLGKYFIAGSRGAIYVFDIETPGKAIEMRTLHTNHGKKFGIVAAMNHNPFSPTIYACGDYSAAIGVFDHNESRQRSLFGAFIDSAHRMGPITQIKWLSEHVFLAGSRTDVFIRAFDIRGTTTTPAIRFKRPSTSNQKISFDIQNGTVVSGTSEGEVVAYDTATAEVKMKRTVAKTAIATAQFHPNLPILLTASGTRTFPSSYNDSDDDVCQDSAVMLWYVSEDDAFKALSTHSDN